MRHVILPAFALLAAFACPAVTSAAADLPEQATSVSGVTMKVTPRNVEGAGWEFEVVFDTHSQELKDDLPQSAVLVIDGGAPVAATGWQGDPPGGHHRKGVLGFKTSATAPQEIELRLQRPSESESRTFRWRLR